MKKTVKSKMRVDADDIANIADQGQSVSRFFSNQGKMVLPAQRVNVDFSATMLKELDAMAESLNISRQAVIKTFIRQALDQHYLAQRPVKAKKSA
jgi:hypothetical protein